MKKVFIFLILIFSVSIFSFDFYFGIDSNFNNVKNYQKITFKVIHNYEDFNFLAELNAINVVG
ncbi:hypothetical protein [Marinitoga litoralis]|uniref:hypothetical protein n=1 Tax=Marinitoga litoralis TaxID=570855 RepID=UPI00196167F2|nr:hypothetical protein [Marinitoga litoralis]MBM7560253.1 hypothetical protein [Marinitoga litoralis]